VIAQLKASSRTVDIVTPWSSLFDHPLRQRARDLGKSLQAEYLLEGSTRHQGRRVRITARLVDTDTEIHLWSGIFEHVVTDTLAVQAEVAGHLAGTIITALESSRRRPRSRQACEVVEPVCDLRERSSSLPVYGGSRC
jgi:TolB-like protein